MESAHSRILAKLQRPFFSLSSGQKRQRQDPPRTSSPIPTMSEDELPSNDHASALNSWSSAPTSQPQAGSTPVSGASAYNPGVAAADFYSQPSMNSSSVAVQHTSTGSPSTSVSSHQDYPASVPMDPSMYMQKPYENMYTLQALTADMPIGQAYTTDEIIPVVDLDGQDAFPGGFYGYPLGHDDGKYKRASGSSFTVSTSGGLSDITPYDDFSANMSDAQSFGSDYPPAASTRTSWMSSTHLSPVASPRAASQNRPDLARTQSRGRASPSPRPSARAAPYSLEGPRSKERWSTGAYGTVAGNRRYGQSAYHMGTESHAVHQSSQVPSYLVPSQPMQRNSMLLPTQLPSQSLPSDPRSFEAPAPLLSQNLFRMLQSNNDNCHSHHLYADLSDPPDLFGCLSEEQSDPPEEDMNPSDPEMVPREQDLRFSGDLYTPKWVRGHGNKREGWCGICKPGRWLVLKNSAYWYDKSFSHGISAATGSPFQEPLDTRRMDGNPDVWEGLCAGCNDWIALVSSKKKGTTWFRHAYKCHSHPKAKDQARRRRDNTSGKTTGSATTPGRSIRSEQSTPHATQSFSPPPLGVGTPNTMALSHGQGPPVTLLSNHTYGYVV